MTGKGKRAFGDGELADGDTCDYTINGLFTISNTMVIHEDGKRQMVFNFADDVCPTCRSPLEYLEDKVRCPNGDKPTDKCARHGYQRNLTQVEIERWEVKKKLEIKEKAIGENKVELYKAVDNFVQAARGPGAHKADYIHDTIFDEEGYTIIILKHPQERYLNGIKAMVEEMVDRWDDPENFVEILDGTDGVTDWHELGSWPELDGEIACPCGGSGSSEDENPTCENCGRDLPAE